MHNKYKKEKETGKSICCSISMYISDIYNRENKSKAPIENSNELVGTILSCLYTMILEAKDGEVPKPVKKKYLGEKIR